MTSLAATIPPELFENILSFVGDQIKLNPFSHFNMAEWREEIKQLAACATVCVYWARLARPRMFNHIALESYEDLRCLQSLLNLRSSSHRIHPIGSMLSYFTLFHTLGDHSWFYNVLGLKTYGVSNLQFVSLHVIGPATAAFIASSNRGPVLHPLSFAAPRILPMGGFHNIWVDISIRNIHLPNRTTLFNLLQDCVSLRPSDLQCENVTWDTDSETTSASPDLKVTYTCRRDQLVAASGCTDDALVAAMAHSIPYHEVYRRPDTLHLSLLDTVRLLNVTRIMTNPSQSSHESKPGRPVFMIGSYGNGGYMPRSLRERTDSGALLHTETDLYFEWRDDSDQQISFHCFTSRSLNDTNGTRYVTCIAIEFVSDMELQVLANFIDWDALLHAILQFPGLRRITIQCRDSGFEQHDSQQQEFLVEFMAYLGEEWTELGDLLELYSGFENKVRGGIQWNRVALGPVLAEVERKRLEEKRGIELVDQLEVDMQPDVSLEAT